MKPIVKIGIAGSHSTGKTSFLSELKLRLENTGVQAELVHSSAATAKSKGFPILRNHTFESTLWMIASCIQQEAEASLTANVILVDRPVFDALAYFHAALELTGRQLPQEKLQSLHEIVRAYSQSYNMVFVTKLDHDVPLGPGRDQDMVYRSAVARHLIELTPDVAPQAQTIETGTVEKLLSLACSHVESALLNDPAGCP